MDIFITGFLLSLSLCLDIGIVNVAMIDIALKHGARPALWLGLGSCFGDLTYAILSLLGMSVLLQFVAVQWLTWIVGGGVLLWLAGKMALHAWRDAHGGEVAHAPLPPLRHLFGRGLTLALASPSAILWFAAVGGSLIAQATDGSSASAAVFLGGFFAGGLAWSIFVCYAAAHGGKLLGRRFIQACHALSATLYLYFAVLVIVNGARKLV
ncbi:L-lysine exporter family protein LysE/ArgO [Andreprevotia lacus DSM 23236]|jgi:L-lysine exporter family protein LysE/ArgO|uniref:L-lysine exporter family protein LysE/ArgO n=1 Tax=Andreprevotia lacus DSM 23236 TaxID=1121001 RepID=A0A1W1XYT0_9NEIS|nr:LysE family transporter [Andreprevotia lacus]SMC28711.1 L-lysine exporter family protein LysE/ArgO [Andreprevotia lacus DSM 23236]